MHRRSKHEGVRYESEQYDSTFTGEDTLTTHMQSIHEGVMYSCNQCNSTFTKKSNLTKHMKSKHKGVKYLCDQCEYIATHKSHLTSHCIFVTTEACYPANSAYTADPLRERSQWHRVDTFVNNEQDPAHCSRMCQLCATVRSHYHTLQSGVSLQSGVWCLVSGVWCLVSGVWCLVSGVWCLVSGVWCLVSGVWCLVSGVWFLVSGRNEARQLEGQTACLFCQSCISVTSLFYCDYI